MKPKKNNLTHFPTALIGVLLMPILLSGCAGVTVTPLNADGTDKNTREGLRYYMPMPCLLVTELPVESAAGALPPLPGHPADQAPGAGATPPAPDPATKKAATDPGQVANSPATISDTSFQAQNAQYMVKLIYLPDLSRPMALSESTGLFGTASMKPVLQDGWMLTSLDASADSKTAETLTAIASLVSAATPTGAGAKAATGALGKGAGAGVDDFSKYILRPGLYKFTYDPRTGELTGLKRLPLIR